METLGKIPQYMWGLAATAFQDNDVVAVEVYGSDATPAYRVTREMFEARARLSFAELSSEEPAEWCKQCGEWHSGVTHR